MIGWLNCEPIDWARAAAISSCVTSPLVISSDAMPMSNTLSRRPPTSPGVVYALAAINSVPSSLKEPDDFILRETTTKTIANETRITTEIYQGTMLNNPEFPSAGEEEVCNEIALIIPSEFDKFTTTW